LRFITRTVFGAQMSLISRRSAWIRLNEPSFITNSSSTHDRTSSAAAIATVTMVACAVSAGWKTTSFPSRLPGTVAVSAANCWLS